MRQQFSLQALAGAVLLAGSSNANYRVLNYNVVDWDADLPEIALKGAREKQWKLFGQTGWFRDKTSNQLIIDLAFIMTTTDDGVPPTEKLQGDDIINIGWAIPTNNHTREVPEYEAGVMTYYKGANGQDRNLPKVKWSMRQTVTKTLNLYSQHTYPRLMVPEQKNATVKEIEWGQKDNDPNTFWFWPQDLVQESSTQIAFQLQREGYSENMVIKAGAVIQGKVGFQAWIAKDKDAMVYGYGGQEWIFKAVETVTDGESSLTSWLLPTTAALAVLLTSF